MQIDLGGETRLLKYSYGALRALELQAGVGIGTVVSPEQQGFNSMCLLVWAGLRHENKRLTLGQVEEWLDEYIRAGGTFQALGILVNGALKESGVFGKDVVKETAEGEA